MQAGADAGEEEGLIRMARSKLRSVDESQFTPLVVPIGPYHHGRECSSERPEEKKKRAADKVLRPGYVKRDKTMDELHSLVVEARACYPDLASRNIGLQEDSKELVEMLLHDGCYVLSFLVDYIAEGSAGHTHEAAGSSPAVMREENWVMRDTLFLLENQIPWFVLKKLHHCIVGNEERSVLGDLSRCVVELLKDRLHISGTRQLLPSASEPSTLLHLVHAYLMPTTEHVVLDVVPEVPPPDNAVAPSTAEESEAPLSAAQGGTEAPLSAAQGGTEAPSTVAQGDMEASEAPLSAAQGGTEAPSTAAAQGVQPREPSPRRRMGRWRRAAEYCRYGNVKLRRRGLAGGVHAEVAAGVPQAHSVLDVRLQGRTLWMPCLMIDSTTWTVLRNLMALEERMDRRPVTAYCVFMSQLACRAEDVELLQRAGIVQHFLANDDELLQGFAGLCKEVVLDVDSPDENYLNRTWHQLHERCLSKRNNFCGFFREIHGGNGVQILAFVGAVFLFLFQLAQVILAGFSFRKSK